MTGRLDIGIAGCGIGGLALAIRLSDIGHKVSLFDRFDAPQPVGSGLVIQPVGKVCLDRLGLMRAAIQRGRPIHRLHGIESASRRTVLRADYSQVGGDDYGLAIHRADLFDLLFSAARQRPCDIVPSAEIVATGLTGSERTLSTVDGRRFGSFDLVVDASGSRSPLSPIKTKALPYGALWSTVQWPEDTALPTDHLSQCYRGAHHMLGVLPLSDDGRTAIFWSEPTDRLSEWFQCDLDDWKRKAVALWPEFRPFAEQITTHDQMIPARYRHGTLAKPYGLHIAYIGDAAHQASPQLGQGANMALLDAMGLADALEGRDLPDALATYAKRRKTHVRFYQTVSDVFTPLYQSGSPVPPFLRNNVFHPASQVWPATRMLTRLISGRLVPTGV